MRVGSIVYATLSGLGLLARDFYRHGLVNRVLLSHHPHYENHYDWYPSHDCWTNTNRFQFLEGLDLLLLFEDALGYWPVVQEAKRRNLPVVLMPMYEWTPYPPPVLADFYLCPSLLDLQYYRPWPSAFLPVPVERPWRLREQALHFIHNTGHGGTAFRNGTPELLEAMQYVKSPIRLTVRGQPGICKGGKANKSESRVEQLFKQYQGDTRVELLLGDVPGEELYSQGDVFVFPERFNGLSLPLQEAYASGMLIMATERFPMTTWLPIEPLIPVERIERVKAGITVDAAVLNPRTIARVIDEWYGRNIRDWSTMGKEWAEQNSWDVLKPKYERLLEAVRCQSF